MLLNFTKLFIVFRDFTQLCIKLLVGIICFYQIVFLHHLRFNFWRNTHRCRRRAPQRESAGKPSKTKSCWDVCAKDRRGYVTLAAETNEEKCHFSATFIRNVYRVVSDRRRSQPEGAGPRRWPARNETRKKKALRAPTRFLILEQKSARSPWIACRSLIKTPV